MMSSHFLGSRASVHVTVSPEDKYHNNQCLPPSFFLLAFITEQTSYGMDYPLGQLGQLSWLCALPRSCPPPASW